jgi:hypothetical protein
VLTLLAAGFLLLDAVLLAGAGWWGGRPVLLIVGGAFAAGAAGVVWLRRRYLERLDQITVARDALKREAAALARSLRGER